MCDKYILSPATGILTGNGKALECSKKLDSGSPHFGYTGALALWFFLL